MSAVLSSHALALTVSLWTAPAENQEEAPPRPLITISRETTRVTEPLRDDGTVDYVAALNRRLSEGVKPETNAAVEFWEALGPKDVSEEIREEFFRRLGMPVPKEDAGGLRALADFEEEDVDSEGWGALVEDSGVACRRPWRREEFPRLAEAVDANAKALDRLVEATRKPQWYQPVITKESSTLIAVEFPHLGSFGSVRDFLRLRAMLRIGESQSREAMEDIVALHRLGRLMRRGPFLIDGLVGVALESIAIRSGAALLHRGRLSHDALAAYRAALRELPDPRPVSEVFDAGERYFFLDGVTAIAQRPSALATLDDLEADDTALSTIANAVTRLSLDWDLILRTGNIWYDRVTFALRKPTHGERTRALGVVSRELSELKAQRMDPLDRAKGVFSKELRSIRVCETMIVLVLGPLGLGNRHTENARLQYRMLHVVLALAEHRADRGSYPDALSDLAGSYLDAPPTEELPGEPLGYRKDGEGFVLWSPGLDGNDESGPEYEEESGDDVVFRLPVPEPRGP